MTDFLLLALTMIVAGWYAYRRSVAHGRVEINHVTTFTFGFLFYWITPLAVRIFSQQRDFPFAAPWFDWFRPHLVAQYAVCCLVLYCCFMLGVTLGLRWFRLRDTGSRPLPQLVLSLATLFGCALLIYSAYS